ncbi:hypothetical protein Q5692_31015 [Microcoleus sp. C2C3]|uniref:hypothetical protein n=1 Tax=unclassified Microcoleus TaxID=2642155 RepID=UPI002FD70798
MITDEDLVPFEFADFFDNEDGDDGGDGNDAPSSRGVVPEYVDRQISRIPLYGDDSRWRLASHLDMFENLNPNGSLSDEQRQAVDNFVMAYQSDSDGECVATEWDFPESQYIAHGCDLDTAIELSESWRRGEYLPIMGYPAADAISHKLNQMQNQPIALDK